MLKDEDIICISSIDWDFNWQGHQEIMWTLAEHGNRVFFVENTGVRAPRLADLPRLQKRLSRWWHGTKGIRKEGENLYVFSPLVFPFPYARLFRWINRLILLRPIKKWMRAVNFSKPIIWTFLPTGIALDLIRHFDRKLAIYYCIADFSKLVPVPRRLQRIEKQVIQQADVVFAQGPALREYCQKYNDHVFVFPFGVKLDGFLNFQIRDAERPIEMKNIKRPILGYVGGLHRHLDWNLIETLARGSPDWSLVFVGPIQTDISQVQRLPNVLALGEKDHADLPRYINCFDVCLIPYALTEYTQSVFPTKLNEYLIMGKPVVSSNLREVQAFNEKNDGVIFIAEDASRYKECIVKALSHNGEIEKGLRVNAALENDWQRRIEEMSHVLEEALREKTREKSKTWQGTLLHLYSTSRKRAACLATSLALLWLLIFHTPFLWSIGRPLRISDAPQKVDAIVVLAGGVGESGKAGQGYEERVIHAVELYRKGYASRMIFSSGFIYALQEADVMKALAVSLGIPPDSVLLEKKARNTYENVLNVREILQHHGWKSILLVSSPYHMRRVSWVIRRVSPELRVFYSPVPNSIFYAQGDGVQWRQIRGILHEYSGIVYYRLLGRL